MSSNNDGDKNSGKKFGEVITTLGAIIVILTGLITIIQYVTGKPSLVSFFTSSSTTPVITHPTPTPSLIPTPMLTPTVRHSTVASSAQSSFTPISYNSFWTWLWWAIASILGVSLPMFLWIINNRYSLERWASLLGTVVVVGIIGIILSLASSFLINYLRLQNGFLISIGVGGGIIFVLSLIRHIFA